MKLKNWNEISQITEELRKPDKKIVFTNGCFDILHAGHIQYLREAKNLGDILIIGLNSDKSTKLIKGKNRPINTELNRATVLAALEFVDYIVIFEEDTPFNLINLIKPDILVKGGDWKENEIIGSDIVKENHGKIISLSYKPGISTTGIIDKILTLKEGI
ncbi:MAG: D-glycero-beta-D-manno-heptose 1-phosphate adenylyltransferase [Armatimonadetes bacterium]|nr:D-glycero-beta-D-manno-heptose 1-phosphate adenylyltransferase [Armatimonadota bacterium]